MKRLLVISALLPLALACDSKPSKSTDSSTPAAAATTNGADLTGAGATFPQPIYSKWIAEFAAKSGVKVNYQSIGSGGGIKQLSEQTVDFGATDAPMSDSDIARAKGGSVYHIPTVVGVVAIAYNLPSVATLKLDGAVLADIFLGKITKWNDARLVALNTGVTLPSSDILVVHRSEGSGTTFIFSDYLAAVSPAWKAGPGKGKELQWPVGLGAKGNEGVAGQIKQTPGALGYIELAYATQNKLATAQLKNASGNFVAPTAASATAAAEAAVTKLPVNSDYRVSIVNSAGAETYPITSFTWLLVYQKMADAAKAKKLADFIKWSLTEGQKDAASLDYAPLPASLASRLTARIDSIGGTGK